MAKSKISIPEIEQATKTFSKDKFLPVYLFFGEDEYTIELTAKQLEKAIMPFITSDFDKEVLYGDDRSAVEIAGLASSFPFGSEKKIIIVKEFDKLRDKKNLTNYLKSPALFTTLILLGSSDTSVTDTEPYKTLAEYGYIFEARELKGARLVDWVRNQAEKNGKTISAENAFLMIDISGEKKDILEAQLEKIFIYLGDKKEIDHDAITSLSAKLKEYNIFDLQNAIGKRQGAQALKVAFNLLDNGTDIILIIGMLTKYFSQLSRIKELRSEGLNDQAAARIIGTHPFFYKDYVAARGNFSDLQILNSVRALLNADIAVKTSQTDSKTIITILLSEMLA